MKFNELNITKHKSARRVGRGIAAGRGKTAGRGTKGQKARTGSSRRPGFSGGQNPLMQQLPKLPGFRSHHAKPEIVYTGQLDQFGVTVIDTTALAEKGLISSPYANVKLLVRGDVTKKVSVKLQAASKTAIEAIQAAGGTYELTPRVGRPKTRTAKEDKKA
jgi:large subunit ribosomal protein L15